ncbi:MAG: nucleoside triphosphate pyrophosphatase [Cyanobium sp.]
MLLLASASPARRRLLEQAAIPHRALVSGVDEETIRDPEPRRLVQLLAQAKAEALALDSNAGTTSIERLNQTLPCVLGFQSGQGCQAVLGCDSLLVLEGQVYGKPADAETARQRWRLMAGRWAELHTGHCLIGADGSRVLETVTTRIQFAAVDKATIAAYVASGEPLTCAGGFALEGRGGLLVERIEGCYSNVIGLSLPLLRRWLAALASSA